MRTPKTKRAAPDRATRDSNSDSANDSAPRDALQRCGGVRRVRLTARCLALSAVFVSDFALTAELFDGSGRLAETWVWP